jgi:hypothetical protein
MHFGEAGQRADVGHRQAGLAQRLCGAAGREQADAEGVEPAREIDQAGLVGNAEQCAPRGDESGIEHGWGRPPVKAEL